MTRSEDKAMKLPQHYGTVTGRLSGTLPPAYAASGAISPNFQDVKAFHERFKVPIGEVPRFLDDDGVKFRINFMQEELDEYRDAVARNDLPGQFDALIDLVYVALGTAVWQGFPWQAGWDAVQRANMAKVRGDEVPQESGKPHRHAHDIVKPEGWSPPDMQAILERARWLFEMNSKMSTLPDEPMPQPARLDDPPLAPRS